MGRIAALVTRRFAMTVRPRRRWLLAAASIFSLTFAVAFATAASAAGGWRSEGPDVGSVHDLAVDPAQPDNAMTVRISATRPRPRSTP